MIPFRTVGFVEASIRRPVATTLLALALVIAGATAFSLLPVSPLPQVDFPTISVQASLPGADPETMATSVAAPLEREFGRIAGVTEMTSASYRGVASVNLQFDLNRDIDGAARDVQAAINAARARLPSNLPNNPTYRKVNPADAPILIIALSSDHADAAELFDVASTIMQQKIAQSPGIGQVFAGGGSAPAVRVSVNPEALHNTGLVFEDLRAAMTQASLLRPLGLVDDEARSLRLSVNDQLETAADWSEVIVKIKDGAPVRLGDVARVRESVEDERAAGFLNGKPSVFLIVFRKPGANILEAVDGVRALLPGLEASLPSGTKADVVVDRSPPIRASLAEVEFTLLLSCGLVMLVVFVFLGDVRAVIAPAATTVASVVGSFGVMHLLGYSLDNLSLMALTISTGFVVDDAVVVLENIIRRIEEGDPPFTAAVRGAGEIVFTVTSISTSLIAVFIPILFMGGMVGRLFREFAVTLSTAVLLSMVLSLTLAPMLCSLALKGRSGASRGVNRFDRAFLAVRGWYEKSLDVALSHQRIVLGLAFAAFVGAVWLYIAVPKGFFPQQDIGRLTGSLVAAQDASFETVREKLRQVVERIGKDPDVTYVLGFTGGGGGGGSTANTARLFVTLKPFGERKADAATVMNRLRPGVNSLPGVFTGLQAVQDLRVGGRASAALYQYTLQSDSFPEIARWAPRLLAAMRGLPEIVDVSSDLFVDGLEARLNVNRDALGRSGLSVQNLDDALYDAFGQRQTTVRYTLLNQYRVVLEADPTRTRDPAALGAVRLPLPGGGTTPLESVASLKIQPTALAVNHQSQFPAATISFNLASGVSLGKAVEAITAATAKIGTPANVFGRFQGTAQAFQDSLAGQPFLLLAAALAVYIVLGVLYESLVHPLTILSTLPSAGAGAAAALWVAGLDLGVMGIIGMVLLIGIVKKNGIMMVDFAVEAMRREGLSAHDAVRKASILRFRPIMMTTAAALLGALPLAFGTGPGSELRKPLGAAVAGGLILSQLLTLYTTPVVFLHLDRFTRSRREGDAP